MLIAARIIAFSVGILFILLVYGAIGYAAYNYFVPAASALLGLFTLNSRSYGKSIAFCATALACAITLYKFRTAVRIHYGLLEMMFGGMSIYAATSPSTDQSDRIQILQIAAGIYIIVRGLDNIKIGLDEKPEHPAWTLWNSVFRKREVTTERWVKRNGRNYGLVAGLRARPNDDDLVEPFAAAQPQERIGE